MNVEDIAPEDFRTPTNDVEVDSLFIGRWSPRAMSGEAVNESSILSLLEAARWAPSCFNAQPWRFAYVMRGSSNWSAVYHSLIDVNQAWAQNAGALIAVTSRRDYESNGQAAPTHSFDAGAAWMSLALQAKLNGLVAHGMQGFEQTAAREALLVPAVYDLPVIVAVGQPGEKTSLPEAYQEREQPSSRKALAEIAFAQSFKGLTS